MTRTNIVLVSIDSLRADHCGHLGGDRALTPTMDALAADGVAFENAIAPGPQTFSSMPVAFTGRHRPPVRLDAYEGETYWERRLAAIERHLDRHPTLPERLQEQGYTTVGITPNPWTSAAAGFDRGFDRFVDLSGKQADGRINRFAERLPGIDTDDRRVELVLNMLAGRSFFNQWEDLYEVLADLRADIDEPYFVWVFLLDTHYPFLTTRSHRAEQSWLGMYASMYRSETAMRRDEGDLSPGVRQSVKRSYRDTVRSVDSFLDTLRTDFGEDDPALIVHSDHGESFGEHGNYGHSHRELYEENLHVPYFVYNAGASDTISEPVSLASIHDVALDVAAEGAVTPDRVTEPYVVSTSMSGTNRALRGERFKYIRHRDEELLFDLERDPYERLDVSEQRTERLESCRERLQGYEDHLSEVTRLYQVTDELASRSDV